MTGTPDDGTAPAEEALPPGVPWYVEGVRFGCTACGKCCHNHGDGFQYVFSTRTERKALAAHFGLSLRSFEDTWCERVAGRISFRSRGDACIFLKDGRCSVYAQRPLQCRTFPFWPELVEDKQTWQRDVADFCPGVGTGPLHDIAAIRAVLKQHGG